MRTLPHRRSLLWYFGLRIIAPFSLALLGLLILGVIVYQQLVASLVFDRDSELGDLAAWDLRIELGEYSNLLRRLASNPELLSLSNDERDAALRNAASRSSELFDGVALLDADGMIIAFMPEEMAHLTALTSAQRDFHAAPTPIDALISNVIMDPNSGESLVALGVSLPGASSDVGGGAKALLGYVRVRGSDMTELMERLTVGGSGYAYLVDRNGRVIYHPEAESVGVDFSDRSYVQKLKAGEAGGTLWDAPTGERWIVDYTPLTEAGWGVVVKEPRDVAVAPALFYGRLLIGVGILVVLAVFYLLWTGVRRVATPIGWLAEQTTRLAAGEVVRYASPSGITEIDSLGQAFERMAEQIAAYRSSLRRYIGLITQSQEDERKRIARELHDDTVQSLIGIARRIELLRGSVTEPQQREQWVALRSMVADAANGVRQISLALRPPVLEDLGLVNALQMLTQSRPSDGGATPDTSFRVEGEPYPLGSDLELMIFRVAQEALNNVRHHASAAHAEVRLAFTPDAIQLTVADDGKGFTVPASFAELVQHGSLGLMGIQERMWAAGGRLELRSAVGEGTSLQVTIPVQTEQSPELNRRTNLKS